MAVNVVKDILRKLLIDFFNILKTIVFLQSLLVWLQGKNILVKRFTV